MHGTRFVSLPDRIALNLQESFMRRQVTGLIAVCLCAISSLVAQTIQFDGRQDIQTSAKHLTGLAVADFNGDKKLDIAVTDD